MQWASIYSWRNSVAFSYSTLDALDLLHDVMEEDVFPFPPPSPIALQLIPGVCLSCRGVLPLSLNPFIGLKAQ